jgi:hypothetical protein
MHEIFARDFSKQKLKIMNGLQSVFPSQKVVLWQTEHVWKGNKKLGGQETMYLAAIIVDTKDFVEIESFYREVKSPFDKSSNITTLKLFLNEPAIITQSFPLLNLAIEFLEFSKNLDIYSWGEDYKIFLQNLELKELPKHLAGAKFHDIRHLFRAYGVPADNYLSSNIPDYFGVESTNKDQSPVSNCRNLACALKALSQTV